MTVSCPYCGSNASLVESSVVYGRDFGSIYLCERYPECDAYVGVHDGTDRPKGSLANAELREWRKRAHADFDRLWKDGGITRREAYRWMMGVMGLSRDDAHIGEFDVAKCKDLIAKVAQESAGTAEV